MIQNILVDPTSANAPTSFLLGSKHSLMAVEVSELQSQGRWQMTFNDIIAALDDITDLLHEIEVETVKRIGEAGVRYAISQSMGNYSLAELADLGYPYSKRHYGGVVGYGDSVDGFNPEQTNVQSGEFVESWSWHHTGRGTGIIENTAPVADILDGRH